MNVYRCIFDGISAVVKYFERQDDRREITNYRILCENSIPTIPILAMRIEALAMREISSSDIWRLGIPEDNGDVEVARCLAQWYFTFHEKGAKLASLHSLYHEYDSITRENLCMLNAKIPDASALFQYLLSNLETLRGFLGQPLFTLNYNGRISSYAQIN